MTNQTSPRFSNIARPYALAAFEYARDHQQLSDWKSFLETAAFFVQQPAIQRLLSNPEVPAGKLFDFFHELLGLQLNAERKNFLQLIAQNKRLNLLPEIYDLFTAYSAALEKISTVRVVTAVEAKADFRKKLAQSLTKRINREVTLACEVDPSIIGGAIIHIGDRVIDGSIRGKLARLLEFSLR